MGNTFIDPNSPANFKMVDGNSLTTFILNYFKNNYTFNDPNDKNFMKKRACCMNSQSASISLPSNDATGNVVPTVLDLKIFSDDEWKNPGNVCTFDGNNFYRSTSDGNVTKNDACANFFNKYCQNVYDSRSQVYSGGLQYDGPYEDAIKYPYNDGVKNPLSVGNIFRDCNCLNSQFNRDPSTIPKEAIDPKVSATNNGNG